MIKKDFKMCPVTKFIVWLILGLIVCIIGISNVFAASYEADSFTAQLYDNYGPNLNAVTTSSNSANHSGILQLVANSSGGAWGISSPTPMLANHTYALTANVYPQDCGSLVLSTYNRIGVGTTLANAKSSYQNNSNATENYSRVVGSNLIQFAFTPTINSSYIVFAFSTNQSCSSSQIFLTDVSFEDLGASGGISESTINNSLNNQTNVLNQSITNSQNAIIQNQNENNQALIESNQELLGNCIKNYMISSDIVNTYNLWQEGNNFQQQTADTSSSLALVVHAYNNGSFVDVLNTTTIISTGIYKLSFTKSSSFNQIMFKLNGVTIDTGLLINVSNLQDNTTYYISSDFFNITQGNIRFKNVIITDVNTTTFVPWGETKCSSKLDDTNNALNNLNDTLNDDTAPTFDTSSISISPNTPISNILLLPINLLNTILTKTNSTCSPISIPFLFNTSISFPCFTISDYLGSTANIIDLCICFVMIYNILMLFVSVFEDITTLRDGFLSLYEPRHAYSGYHPKHGKD